MLRFDINNKTYSNITAMRFKLFTLLACLFCSTATQAASNDDLLRMEADMLKYISTSERDTFITITNNLKEASKEAGNEHLFYKAWSKQAIYEATHQNYQKASEINRELSTYATKENSNVGKYFALHTRGFILMQQDSMEDAEKEFLKALDLRHHYFPKESAAEDLRELMKIAYLGNDYNRSKKYANMLLSEPNLAPHHKGRTLYRLSIMAFEEDDVEEFNRIYDEMKRLMQTNNIRSLNLFTEVNYHIINGDYKQALRLADWLSPDSCAERKAIIYHRMGDNEKAYEYMAQYKHVFDSITRVSHSNTVSNLYLRMNNDRLRLEREVLEHQNKQLHYQLYIGGGILLILFLLILIYQRHKNIKLLKYDNQLLNYDKEGAERALKDLDELSFYESKNELPLTSPVKINKFCNRLTGLVQEHCYKGVTAAFISEFDDDYEISTNSDALEKLLMHLLNYSARYTHKGSVKLACTDSGDNVRFSVTDTSSGLGKMPSNFVSIFAEQENVGMNFGICQSITRLLHGRIWHDTNYTNGTRFIFELPKQPQM